MSQLIARTSGIPDTSLANQMATYRYLICCKPMKRLPCTLWHVPKLNGNVALKSTDSKQIHRSNKNSFTSHAVKDNNRGYVAFNGSSTLFYINTQALCKYMVKRTKEFNDSSFNVQLHTHNGRHPNPHHYHHYYTRQPPMKYWHFQGMRSLC